MRLRARIERSKYSKGRAIRLTFPKGVKPFVRESIIVRNIGPRPWSEASTCTEAGEAVVMYFGR